MNEIKINREKTQPLKEKTSGSTFKNPKNNFAAKLIEMSNCKGLSEGGIFVSNKHANFLINKQQGTANQIEELGNKIIANFIYYFSHFLETKPWAKLVIEPAPINIIVFSLLKKSLRRNFKFLGSCT